MRNLFLAIVLGLSACAGSLSDKHMHDLKVACAVDGAVVPLADPMIAAAVPSAAPAVATDALVVHPAIVALCASVGGSPVEVAAAVLAASQADPKVAAALNKSAPAVGAAVQVTNDVNTLTDAAKKAAASVK